jgi:hypothetical protein
LDVEHDAPNCVSRKVRRWDVVKLGKFGAARSRADALCVRTCTYLRNEGFDAFRKGDTASIKVAEARYAKAISTVEVISNLSSRDREQVISAIERAFRGAQYGVKEAVVRTTINDAPGAASTFGRTVVVKTVGNKLPGVSKIRVETGIVKFSKQRTGRVLRRLK